MLSQFIWGEWLAPIITESAKSQTSPSDLLYVVFLCFFLLVGDLQAAGSAASEVPALDGTYELAGGVTALPALQKA